MRTKPPHFSLDELRDSLFYDPQTGTFTRRGTRKFGPRWNGRFANKPTGNLSPEGYVDIRIDAHLYGAHLLAWFYMTGKWPENRIDHRDLDKSNNRWSNLREATQAQNGANRPPQQNNTSGFKGVSWNKQKSGWEAKIQIDGKTIHLGRCEDPESAHLAYCLMAHQHFAEYARFS